MANKQKLRAFIIGLLGIVITLVIAIAVGGTEKLQEMRFWCALGPLLASEIILTITYCGLFGRSDNASFPIRFAVSALPWLYFAFTLVMALIVSVVPAKAFSDTAVLIVQVIVMFIVLVYIVAVEMAADTVQAHAAESAAANASRMSYRATVDGILETLRGRFGGDKEMGKLFEQLYDAARYACDTVPGGEKIESELEERLMKLESSADSIDADAVKSSILQILSSFRKRESIMKSLR